MVPRSSLVTSTGSPATCSTGGLVRPVLVTLRTFRARTWDIYVKFYAENTLLINFNLVFFKHC